MTAQLAHILGPCCHRVEFPRRGLDEVFITASGANGTAVPELYSRFRACLGQVPGARIVRERRFGEAAWEGEMPLSSSDRPYSPSGRLAEWPVTRLTNGNGESAAICGLSVYAVRGPKVRTLRREGRVIGAVFEDSFARYCLLGDVCPDDKRLPREEQARWVFEALESALPLAGMNFSHVVRTWLYLDNILAWYDGFNKVRRAFFSARKVYDGLVPASTGIGSSNSAGTAIVADALAILPKDPRVRLQALPSPLQCPALEYGSAFSRAAEVTMPDHRRLFVSGTASIDPQGRTAHVGNAEAQTRLTMEVVEAILKSRKMDWSDVNRAIAYFSRAADAPVFDRYCAARGLPRFPVVLTKGDICREDLLFEIEVDALQYC